LPKNLKKKNVNNSTNNNNNINNITNQLKSNNPTTSVANSIPTSIINSINNSNNINIKNEKFGKGVFLSDTELIELLKKPPKSTLVLRTKGSFQEFFKGINTKRFCDLLEKAYENVENSDDRKSKINKRLDLLLKD
jgi:hypothetical protein